MRSADALDFTHDPHAVSWVESANGRTTDFPLQNLPFGVFRTQHDRRRRIGTRIGDRVLDLHGLVASGQLQPSPAIGEALRGDSLNELMGLGSEARVQLRHSLFLLLSASADPAAAQATSAHLVDCADASMDLPAKVGDFTDFYSSIHHASRAGQIVRPQAPLLPNFKSTPIAYHGRSSSIAITGTPCHRPRGQVSATSGYVESRKLDFELELGIFVGRGAPRGRPLHIDQAEDAAFGCCLVNDWSARDIQRWESAPLGPFLSKSFLTTLSPWVVTLEALAPFRSEASRRPDDAPALAAELASDGNARRGAIDIQLRAWLQTRSMREQGVDAALIANPNFRDQYWTIAQMLTHHTSNGCDLRPGDLVSSGTVSGPTVQDSGCLLERTSDGDNPILLTLGDERGYLENGDVVIFGARCERSGFRSIGFGECRSEVLAPLVAMQPIAEMCF